MLKFAAVALDDLVQCMIDGNGPHVGKTKNDDAWQSGLGRRQQIAEIEVVSQNDALLGQSFGEDGDVRRAEGPGAEPDPGPGRAAGQS